MPSLMSKPKSMCPGKDCPGCSSASCYAEGGSVDSWSKREDNEKGVHQPTAREPGQSMAGQDARVIKEHPDYESKEDYKRAAVRKHKGVLGDLKSMKKPKLYASGGKVSKDDVPEPNAQAAQQMQAGATSGELPASQLYANLKEGLHMSEGGAIEDGEDQMDSELHEAMGGELMDALERKDKKGIMSALEAAIMQCMGKE